MKNILVINGPNLNLLGVREKSVYGDRTLEDICAWLKEEGEKIDVNLSFFQSNHEGYIIDKIHLARNKFDGIVINPGAYTHYSYAIRDAIAGVSIPTVEIHLSDIKNREEFRKVSVIEPVCIGQVYGEGEKGYLTAIRKLIEVL